MADEINQEVGNGTPADAPTPASTPEVKPQAQPDPLESPGAVSQNLEAAAKAADPEPEIEYPVYNNESADAIVGTLKAAKVPANKAKELFQEAVQSLDASKINKEQLIAVLGKDGAEITMLRMEKVLAEKKAYIDDVVKSIQDTMGGKSEMDKVFTWAKTKAKADEAFGTEYTEYVQMLDASKVKAKLAAEALKKLYLADPNNSSLGVKMVTGDKSAQVIEDTAVLTRAQYLEAMKRANAEGNFKEMERLDGIRLRSMQNNN